MDRPLTELEPGQEATILSIQGGRGLQSRLRGMGLCEGRRLRKLSALAWGGPVVVLLNRAQVAIGRGMAGRILVRS